MRRRQALEEPDVRHRAGELDMAHPLAAHPGPGDLHAALVADDATVLHPLVFAAQALPVRDRTEDLGAEEAVPLRLERPVVDRLRLGHFAVAPGTDLLRRRDRDLDRVEILERLWLVKTAEWLQLSVLPLDLEEFHVETEALELAHENVERLRAGPAAPERPP